MTDELYTALSLLMVGMITVFVVLLLVVLTGNLLIRYVNYRSRLTGIDPNKIAAINAAVEIITKGQGVIEKIESKK